MCFNIKDVLLENELQQDLKEGTKKAVFCQTKGRAEHSDDLSKYCTGLNKN